MNHMVTPNQRIATFMARRSRADIQGVRTAGGNLVDTVETITLHFVDSEGRTSSLLLTPCQLADGPGNSADVPVSPTPMR
jgi:hypothetical protein